MSEMDWNVLGEILLDITCLIYTQSELEFVYKQFPKKIREDVIVYGLSHKQTKKNVYEYLTDIDIDEDEIGYEFMEGIPNGVDDL